MASAGRILIMPKGKYNAETEYEMLDLVEHNNRAWIAKKDCVGIEPSDTNKEYWHDMFDKGLAYLPLTGGVVTGSIIANQSAGDALFAKRTINDIVYEQSMGGVSTLNIGGENVADFTFRENGVSRAQLVYNENGVGFVNKATNPESAFVKMLFGEHNKINGNYVGNGSNEERIIEIAGISTCLMIWSNHSMAIVSPVGAICASMSGGVVYIDGSKCHYNNNGPLTLHTDLDVLNGEGINYRYQCL